MSAQLACKYSTLPRQKVHTGASMPHHASKQKRSTHPAPLRLNHGDILGKIASPHFGKGRRIHHVASKIRYPPGIFYQSVPTPT